MPVQYRTFYIHKLSSVKDTERRHYDAEMSKQKGGNQSSQISRGPAINRS